MPWAYTHWFLDTEELVELLYNSYNLDTASPDSDQENRRT
jgi:hypothetical protein